MFRAKSDSCTSFLKISKSATKIDFLKNKRQSIWNKIYPKNSNPNAIPLQ